VAFPAQNGELCDRGRVVNVFKPGSRSSTCGSHYTHTSDGRKPEPCPNAALRKATRRSAKTDPSPAGCNRRPSRRANRFLGSFDGLSERAGNWCPGWNQGGGRIVAPERGAQCPASGACSSASVQLRPFRRQSGGRRRHGDGRRSRSFEWPNGLVGRTPLLLILSRTGGNEHE